MIRLFSLIYTMTGPTLAGIFVVAALVAGLDTLVPIVAAAGIGFVAAVPVSWFVAKALAPRA